MITYLLHYYPNNNLKGKLTTTMIIAEPEISSQN